MTTDTAINETTLWVEGVATALSSIAHGGEHAGTTGRLTWLKRGWPNEWAQLTQQLPSLKAFS